MSLESLNQLLHKEIPLCEFMQMNITVLTDIHIETTAPLEPNRNMHHTGFAGSLYALAVATGWALAHHRQSQFEIAGSLVVKEATIHYKRPVKGDIHLKASLTEEVADIDLKDAVLKEGRASLPLVIWIYAQEKKCAYLEADYVIVPD
jgi:thioesterase domain-containing protein